MVATQFDASTSTPLLDPAAHSNGGDASDKSKIDALPAASSARYQAPSASIADTVAAPAAPPQEPALSLEAKTAGVKLLHRLHDNTKSWADAEGIASGTIAAIAAASIGARAPYFANELLNGPDAKTVLTLDEQHDIGIGTTVAAATPTALLSFNAHFLVWNRAIRALRRGDLGSEDVKRFILPLLLISLSPVTSYKQALDAYPKAMYPILRYLIGAGGVLSAVGTNGLFATRMKKNLFEKAKKSNIINLLRTAEYRLNFLAAKDPKRFIQVMHDSRFFELLSNLNFDPNINPEVKIRKILDSLINILDNDGKPPLPPEDQKTRLSRCCNDSVTTGVIYFVGALSSLSYFSGSVAAATDPDVFGTTLTDPNSSIGTYWKWGAGIVIGISSLLANAAINAIATSDSTKRRGDQIKCSCTCECDCSNANISLKDALNVGRYTILTLIVLYNLTGYSAAQGGMAIEYPFLKTFQDVFKIGDKTVTDVALIQAILNVAIYLSIGDMTFANFWANFKNGYFANFKHLLDNAKGKDLNQYYAELGNVELNAAEKAVFSTTNQEMFIKLCVSYNKWAFECLIEFFSYQPEVITTPLVGEELMEDIDNLFGLNSLVVADNPTAAATAPSSARLDAKEKGLTQRPRNKTHQFHLNPPPTPHNTLQPPAVFTAAATADSLGSLREPQTFRP